MDFTGSRTARDAARGFLGTLGASLSCVVRSRLVPSSPDVPVDVATDVRLTTPGTLRLSDKQAGTLLLNLKSSFVVSSASSNGSKTAFRVTSVMYEYRLLDRLERELLVYHWQPGPRFAGPDHPHLHVSASIRAATSAVDEREIDLDRLHLPTGPVPLAAVVRSLVTELGVEPLRPDWARVLDEGEAVERGDHP